MPVPTTNDGSQRPPRLRLDIHDKNLLTLPDTSPLRRLDEARLMTAVTQAGFEGIQTDTLQMVARAADLRVTSSCRIDSVQEAESKAKAAGDAGYELLTLHVGTGLEDDDAALRLVESVLAASDKLRFPLYIETHRATITQDLWRTVQLTRKLPEIRFNGDFSHYYTGQEMAYGDFAAKLDFMQPIFDRVRFIHGRIGNPGCIQVDIGDGCDRPYVGHFKLLWTRAFGGFLKSAKPGDLVIFAPELLDASIYYARLFRGPAGELQEESDRWEQAQVLARIAQACFVDAVALAAKSST